MCLNVSQQTELAKLLIELWYSIVISIEVRLLCIFHLCIPRSKMSNLEVKDTMKISLKKKLLQF